MTAKQVADFLRYRYRGDQWTWAEEVGNATGENGNRRCDFVAMGMWPSKGVHLHGHEIKVTRSDWLKEIQDTSKARAHERYCHYWWIVAPPGVLKLEELPANWGFMQVGTNSVRVKKPASITTPEIDHSFVAALFRAVKRKTGVDTAIRQAYHRGYREGVVQGQRGSVYETRLKQEKRKLEELQISVNLFQKVSGIEIDAYNGPDMGMAVSLLAQNRQAQNPRLIVDNAIRAAQAAVDGLEVIHKAQQLIIPE